MRGDGRIFQRRQIWQISYYVDGREHRESSGSTDREVAERLLKKRLREKAVHEDVGKPFVGPEQKRVRVSKLLDALKRDCELRGLRSISRLVSHINQVRDAFGDQRAIRITPEALDRYVASCLEAGVARATINRRLQILAQAFRLAVERKLLGSAPRIRRLSEEGNTRQGFFEKGDFEAVVKHLPAYLKDFTRFAYLTGWRRGEVASLTWANVDLAGRAIRLRPEASKNREGRLIPLEGELWEVIERRQQEREISTKTGETILAAHVFHLDGQPVGDFRKAWLMATKAAKLEGKLFHDLRRTAVRNMIRAGVPERVAMQISGHKTRHVFDRYNIVSEADLREAVHKTQTYLQSTPSDCKIVPLTKAKRATR